MKKSVGPWKAEYLADDLYCVKRDVFYPETGVTVIEHVRRVSGCIDVFSADDAMRIVWWFNEEMGHDSER